MPGNPEVTSLARTEIDKKPKATLAKSASAPFCFRMEKEIQS